MWNLLKYSLLGRKKYYLIFILILLGVYLSLIFLTSVSKKDMTILEGIFNFSFLAFSISIVVSLIINIRFMASEDLSYLSFSLPIKPSLLLYKNLIILLIELLFLTLFNLFLMTILSMSINTKVPQDFIFYLFKQGGIISIFLFPLSFLIIFLIISLYVVSSKLPYEDRFLKFSCYLLSSLYMIFSDSVENSLAQIFPYKLPFSIPGYDFEKIYQVNGNISIESYVSASRIEFNIAVILYNIFTFIFFITLISYLLNKKVEIK